MTDVPGGADADAELASPMPPPSQRPLLRLTAQAWTGPRDVYGLSGGCAPFMPAALRESLTAGASGLGLACLLQSNPTHGLCHH